MTDYSFLEELTDEQLRALRAAAADRVLIGHIDIVLNETSYQPPEVFVKRYLSLKRSFNAFLFEALEYGGWTQEWLDDWTIRKTLSGELPIHTNLHELHRYLKDRIFTEELR